MNFARAESRAATQLGKESLRLMKSLMISASRPCRLSCLESSSLRRSYFSVEWIFPPHRSLPCRAFGPLSGLSEQAGHIGTSVNVQLCWGMTVDTLSHWASDSESMVHAKTPHPLNELTYNLRGEQLEEPYNFETSIANGARVSEVPGLKWKHVNSRQRDDCD